MWAKAEIAQQGSGGVFLTHVLDGKRSTARNATLVIWEKDVAELPQVQTSSKRSMWRL